MFVCRAWPRKSKSRQGNNVLVAPGSTVDFLLASSVGGDQDLAAKAAQSYLFNFNEISIPQTLANRHVTDTNKLPTYPFPTEMMGY